MTFLYAFSRERGKSPNTEDELTPPYKQERQARRKASKTQ